jgi:glycine cleavage system protein P-like pyridoxal-binding family
MGIGGSKNVNDEGDRELVVGRPDLTRCDNMITTSKYTVWTFLPLVRGSCTMVHAASADRQILAHGVVGFVQPFSIGDKHTTLKRVVYGLRFSLSNVLMGSRSGRYRSL